MISGSFTSSREAVIRLEVRGQDGTELEIEAVIDTGFNGSLTLPPALIEQLDLAWRQRGRAVLADGTSSLFDTYEATLMWDGASRRVAVDELDTSPLVGTFLLYGHDLSIEAVAGGKVVIQAREPAPAGPTRV